MYAYLSVYLFAENLVEVAKASAKAKVLVQVVVERAAPLAYVTVIGVSTVWPPELVHRTTTLCVQPAEIFWPALTTHGEAASIDSLELLGYVVAPPAALNVQAVRAQVVYELLVR